MRSSGYKVIYVLIALFASALYLSGSSLKAIFNLKNEVSFHEERLIYLKTYNKRTSQEFQWLQKEEEYIKYLARKRLGFIEPDEVKFFIVMSDDKRK